MQAAFQRNDPERRAARESAPGPDCAGTVEAPSRASDTPFALVLWHLTTPPRRDRARRGVAAAATRHQDEERVEAVLYSDYAEDPSMADIVQAFVAELQGVVDELCAAFHGRDGTRLRRLAHRLRGAAGSHGFHSITLAAGHIEDALVREAATEEVARDVAALVAICARVRDWPAREPVAASEGA